MNRFIQKIAMIATLIALVSVAATAQAQNAGIVVQVPGTSTAWFNTYADDAVRYQHKQPDTIYGQSAKDQPTLGVERPYHRGYYGKIKPRRHYYSNRSRRNVRGYANAPWDR